MCPVFGILFADILCRIFYRTKSNYLICKCIRNRKQWQRNNGPAKYFPYGWWVNEQPTDPNIERDRERKREMRANEHERTKRKSERETERQSFFSSLYSTGTFSVQTKYNTTCRISLAYSMNIYIYIYIGICIFVQATYENGRPFTVCICIHGLSERLMRRIRSIIWWFIGKGSSNSKSKLI